MSNGNIVCPVPGGGIASPAAGAEQAVARSELPSSPASLGLLRRFGPVASFYQRLWTGYERDYSELTTRFGAIAAAGTSSTTIAFSSDYFWFLIKGRSTTPTTFLVRITDAQSGEFFSNDYVALANLCGRGAQPKILPAPKLIRKGSVLTFDVKNDDASVQSVFAEIVLGGVVFSY